MDLESLNKQYSLDCSLYLNLDGNKIHYTDRGKGDVVVFLHGIFSSLHTFEYWAYLLAKDFRVITIDMPGFGLTKSNPKNDYSIPFYIEFINQFTKELGIEKLIISGNSLGGWIAWEFAVAFPEKVIKMILVNSAGYINSGKFPLPFVLAKSPILKNIFKVEITPRRVVKFFINKLIIDKQVITANLIDRYYNIALRKENMQAFLKIANSNLVQNTNSLRDIKIPTLILWGEKDLWISSKHAYSFKKDIQNSIVKIYDNVGHVPMEEIPEESFSDVLNFLMD
tara:strand:+ start:2977 stop:3822 length:846 start_codon:yes stop_codon:yes gene_type:complete